jgi:hypothetical protein
VQKRKRWFAELAGVFLLWAEEWPENPPWKAYILRRATTQLPVSATGELLEVRILSSEHFVARSERIAIDAIETTIRNSRSHEGYAHRFKEAEWRLCEVSDKEWATQCERFKEGHDIVVLTVD